MDWNDAWEAAGEVLTNDQTTIFEMSVRLAQLEAEKERLKKELRDERVARLAEWLEEDRIDKEQFDDAIEELQALGGE